MTIIYNLIVTIYCVNFPLYSKSIHTKKAHIRYQYCNVYLADFLHNFIIIPSDGSSVILSHILSCSCSLKGDRCSIDIVHFNNCIVSSASFLALF